MIVGISGFLCTLCVVNCTKWDTRMEGYLRSDSKEFGVGLGETIGMQVALFPAMEGTLQMKNLVKVGGALLTVAFILGYQSPRVQQLRRNIATMVSMDVIATATVTITRTEIGIGDVIETRTEIGIPPRNRDRFVR